MEAEVEAPTPEVEEATVGGVAESPSPNPEILPPPPSLDGGQLSVGEEGKEDAGGGKAPQADDQVLVKEEDVVRPEKHEQRDRERDKDRSKKSRRSRSRSRDRQDRKRDKSRDRKRRSRSRSRGSRRRRSASRERDRRRSRSRDRKDSRRSRSRDKKERSSRRKSRSKSRERKRSGSPDLYGGYVPRPPRQFSKGGEAIAAPSAPTSFPAAPPIANAYGAAVPVPPKPQDPPSVQQLLQQQQLHAQQLLLQQQLLSAGSANSAKAQKEARAARRVYVGNLQPHMVTEDQLKAIFNSALMAAFPGSSIPGLEPVVAITRQAEGKYSFIEFRTPEMATAALQLSGQVTLHGKAMTVQRPQDYVDPAQSAQAAQIAHMMLAGIPQPGMQQFSLPGAFPGALPGPPPM